MAVIPHNVGVKDLYKICQVFLGFDKVEVYTTANISAYVKPIYLHASNFVIVTTNKWIYEGTANQ